MFKGEWKLVDFDNAQLDGASHAACCTLRYAAPEVVVARRAGASLVASAAIDVWAMAIILCHLFSGRPLHGDDELDGLEERLATRPADVASALERAAGLSDPQRRLLHEMVAVAPAERRGAARPARGAEQFSQVCVVLVRSLKHPRKKNA